MQGTELVGLCLFLYIYNARVYLAAEYMAVQWRHRYGHVASMLMTFTVVCLRLHKFSVRRKLGLDSVFQMGKHHFLLDIVLDGIQVL
jgi:hypothetical protein